MTLVKKLILESLISKLGRGTPSAYLAVILTVRLFELQLPLPKL